MSQHSTLADSSRQGEFLDGGIGVAGDAQKTMHPTSDNQTPDWTRTANMARAIRRPRDSQLPMLAPARVCRPRVRGGDGGKEMMATYRLFIQLDMLARNVWGRGAVQR